MLHGLRHQGDAEALRDQGDHREPVPDLVPYFRLKPALAQIDRMRAW